MSKSKKTNQKAAKTAPVVKSVDAMIEDNPAHSSSSNREYLRQLIKGKLNEDWQRGGR